ncbi:MAG: DUF5694 domain-containing protein [Caulobacteraceae bacterium]
MLRTFMTACFAVLTTAAAAQTYRSDFDPSRLKGPHAGPPNEVMVLGTPHLSELPPAFKPDQTQPLLDRLAAWRPQAIGVEALSGIQCEDLRRYPQRYADTVKTYCWDPYPARAATGLDVPSATAEADRLLATWSAAPSSAQRRHLAAVFLAAGEQPSAEVQWLRLSPAERRAGDGLDAILAAHLEALRVKRNEVYLIAASLAAHLGLERLYAVDDHTADTPDPADVKAYGAAISKAWSNPATAERKRADDVLDARLGQPGALLAIYQAYNSPGQGSLVFRSDMGAALEEPSPQRFGRGYVGYWETRNLRMAANIRAVLADQPGERMLVIVGASHRGYLEAYLNEMHDVRLADADSLLR